MPPKPHWYGRLPTIRRHLEAMTDSPWLDRPAIERLFGVRARQANNIMRGLPGRQVGTAVVVDREAILSQLETLAGPKGYAGELNRKTSVLVEVDRVRLNPERSPVVSPPPPRRAHSALPEGVRIASRGVLSVDFTSAEDLLGRILGLTQTASTNFAAFADALELVDAPAETAPA